MGEYVQRTTRVRPHPSRCYGYWCVRPKLTRHPNTLKDPLVALFDQTTWDRGKA